jgi:PAS domain S-box-containing protein
MKDQDKTKEQLINELEELRRRISGLEALEAEHLRAEMSLRQAEEEKRAILDSLLEHVVYHDMEMRILWANRVACESVGMTREELDGRYCYEIWSKRSNPCKDCPVKRARETGHPHVLEKKTPDGRSWYIQGSPVIDTNGDIVGMVELTLEITERKRTEEALRKSEKRYRALAENSWVGFWHTTLEGYTIYVNPAMCAILEIKNPEELSGKTYHSFYDSENLEIIKRELAKRPKGISSNYEVEIVGKNGQRRNVVISEAPIFSEEGKLQSVIGTFTDITERKRAEEALRKTHEMLERRVQERTAELLKRNEQLTREIENRKQAEKALQESRTELSTIFDNAPVLMVLVDKERRVRKANRAVLEFTSRSKEEIIGCRGGEALGCLHSLDDPKGSGFGPSCQDCMVRLTVLDTIKTGKAYQQVETTLPFTRGKIQKELYLLVSTAPLTVKENKMAVVCIQDITNRKRAEDALRGSEQMLKVILAASPVGICLLRNRIIDWTNQAMYRIWGYEEGSLLGENTKMLYPDVEEYERIGREFYSEIEHKETGQMETRWVAKDGRDIHCYLQGCPIDPYDISKGVIMAAMDITKLKQAQDQIQTLSQQLIHSQEHERQMISYELHDSVAQNLSTLKIGCDMLFMLFEGQFAISPELKERIAQLSKHIGQIIISVRQLAYDLRPPGLDEMGLLQALDMYCEDFSENRGVKVDFHSAGMQLLDLGFSTEIHLYRLVQEGLNNIRKHADADQATIRLVGAFPNIILRIEDDGKGFNVKARELALGNEKRMGLRSMKERVNLLGGQMTIQSRPMQGTKVFIKIPYKRQKDESEKKHINH